eukprot:GHVQ01037178.1.p1 GENE.GHVQ01037178.1~~GHVQ01037178.1.p1  ORF type:complete len:688 (-),score=63.63 GHVQ01037178.1:2522-4585(-)
MAEVSSPVCKEMCSRHPSSADKVGEYFPSRFCASQIQNKAHKFKTAVWNICEGLRFDLARRNYQDYLVCGLGSPLQDPGCLVSLHAARNKNRAYWMVGDGEGAMLRASRSHVRLNKLKIIRPIGSGSYGKVYLVRKKSCRGLFALKAVKKIPGGHQTCMNKAATRQKRRLNHEKDFLIIANNKRRLELLYRNSDDVDSAIVKTGETVSSGENSTCSEGCVENDLVDCPEEDNERHAAAGTRFVVQLYDCFQDSGYVYQLLEYLPGGTLKSKLARVGTLPEEVSKFIAMELMLAVTAVETFGYVHRDLKPDNIMLDSSGHIRLLDFGLCGRSEMSDKFNLQHSVSNSKLKGDSSCVTLNGHTNLLRYSEKVVNIPERDCLKSHVGSLRYMAPEVLNGCGYDNKVDWWALGVILYECMVGEIPPPVLSCLHSRTSTSASNIASEWLTALRRLERLALSTGRDTQQKSSMVLQRSNGALVGMNVPAQVKSCQDDELSLEAVEFLKGLLCEKNHRISSINVARQYRWFDNLTIPWEDIISTQAPEILLDTSPNTLQGATGDVDSHLRGQGPRHLVSCMEPVNRKRKCCRNPEVPLTHGYCLRSSKARTCNPLSHEKQDALSADTQQREVFETLSSCRRRKLRCFHDSQRQSQWLLDTVPKDLDWFGFTYNGTSWNLQRNLSLYARVNGSPL